MNEAENLEDVLFYSFEKSIKKYRQFAQQQLVEKGFDITIDQWLLLKTLNSDLEQTQHQIAEKIFKDYASVTRMIELLVKKRYLIRTMNEQDRRRFNLTLTQDTLELLKAMQPIVENNRSIALSHISKKQINQFQQTLNLIFNNCNPASKSHL